ncbi:MAG: precorrin-6A reductase [Desulfuromonadales bacterium]|nr:precorrin-6A reductase [Desulfuromonadales bacterium]
MPKVLLLGGASETAPLALKLAQQSFQVLVSTATDEPLAVGEHTAISRRCGRLTLEEMGQLITQEHCCALVDATHPYAKEAHRVARLACEQTQRPYLRYQRPESEQRDSRWLYADNHEQAALLACELAKPILLTVGSRNLRPYVEAATKCGLPLYARVLEHPESVAACDAAGLDSSQRIFGRGPFSFEDNLNLLQKHQIGVLVTKESGAAGGVLEKWRAAQQQGCRFVVVKRPQEPSEHVYSCMDQLITSLRQRLNAQEFA